MKEIKLSQTGKNKGKYVALVDDEDYEYLNQWKWHVNIESKTIYVRRTIYENKIYSSIAMHSQIMQPPSEMEIDHIDHNGLNNQKSNLRLCTRSQNAKNRTPRGASKYLGVYYEKRKRKYQAQININGVVVYLGRYVNEIDAAMAYDNAAKQYHLEFANLNFQK